MRRTTPPRRPGIPLQVRLGAPAWVRPAGGRSAGPTVTAWWPVGRLSYIKPGGQPVDGALVIALGADLTLRVVDLGRMVVDARTDWPDAPAMGGRWQMPLRRALALGAAICERAPVEIGYRKPARKGRKRPHALIVGCGATKAATPQPAADLYIGPLFKAARRHAEASGLPWRILSAEHGLLHPSTVVAPYDHQLAASEVSALGASLRPQLDALAVGVGLSIPAELRVELHAGRLYADALNAAQASFSTPLAGLQIGQRLRWYKMQREAGAETRRLVHVAPHDSGTAITALDLDRDAPRTFRLDRIAWVRTDA